MLMVTALMGLGEGERAAACCRALLGCGDPQRRAQARDLLQVLEAPALRRPRDWSLTLPKLDQAPPLEGIAAGGRRSRQPPKPPPAPLPPVGPTENPRGFVALVVVVLTGLLLASLLSGCLRVESDLHFAGPGHVRLRHRLEATAGTPLPFQHQLAATLAEDSPPYQVREDGATTVLTSPLLNLAEASTSLSRTLEVAAAQVGMTLPPPSVELRESNWLLGVRQRGRICLDLRSLPSLPGLQLSLRLSPLETRAVRRAQPNGVDRAAAPRVVRWPLRLGDINTLEIQTWRWNPLGIGALLIAGGLLVVVQVQRMRVRLGLGLPELPA
jgi:hypothetical protein